MTTGSPVGPTACDEATEGSGPPRAATAEEARLWLEVASLCERLTTAEAALLPRANDAADYKARMEAFHDLLEAALADAAALREQLDQERTQHAGCLVAAEGGTSEPVVAKQGDYGWSLAYQKTLDLRRAYEAARERVTRAEALLRRAYEDACDRYGRDLPAVCELPVECWQHRARAFLAPTEPDGASETKPECASCQHPAERHTPECDCGCWGFFRKGARRCDNPRCEGSGCKYERGTDHGPNDLGAAIPEGTPGEEKP